MFFGEYVAGLRPATFSQKYGLCPFSVFGVFRQPKAGDVFTKIRLVPVQVFRVFGVFGGVRGCSGCSGWFGVFGVFRRVFRVDDILEGQKGDQGGGPKLANAVKPDIFKRAAPKRPKFNMWPEGWGPKGGVPQISRFFPSPAEKFVLFFPLWVV